MDNGVVRETKVHLMVIFILALAMSCSAEKGRKNGSDSGPDGSGDSGEEKEYKGSVGDAVFLGPFGGAATHIVEDPSQAGRVYAIVSGYLHVSNDNGQSWTAISTPDSWGVTGIFVKGNGDLVVGTDFEVLYSTDNGSTWDDIRANIEQNFSYNISVAAIGYQEGSPGRLWVGLGGYYNTAPLWYLEDGSATWVPWNPPSGWDTNPINGDAYFTDICVFDDSTSGQTRIFLTYSLGFAAGGGVFCSMDSGATFSDCSGGLPDVPYKSVIVHDDDVIVAGGDIFGDAYAGIYYSSDWASTWNESTSGWADPIANNITVTSSGHYLASSFGQGIKTSADLGGQWSDAGGFGQLTVNHVAELSNGHVLAGPEQLGIERSEDGALSFNPSSDGLERLEAKSASVDPSDSNIALASANSMNSGLVLGTTTGANGWRVLDTNGNPRFTNVYVGPSGKWYVVTDGPLINGVNDGIWVSEDQGQSFDLIGPKTGEGIDHIDVLVLETDEADQLIAAGTYWADHDVPFLSLSNDGGSSWEQLWVGDESIEASLTDLIQTGQGSFMASTLGESIVAVDETSDVENVQVPGVIDGAVWSIAHCVDEDANMLAIGADSEEDIFSKGLFASSDGGSTWELLEPAEFPDETPYAVKYHPSDCSIVFVVTSAGMLLVSMDSGASWSEVETMLSALNGISISAPDDDGNATLTAYGLGGVSLIPLGAEEL